MNLRFYLFFTLISSGAFGQASTESVGDIVFDETTDRADFKLCFPPYTFQYFNNSGGVEYQGEKIALEKEFREKYKPVDIKGESGLIRIRFVVNCEGETDRFRMTAMRKDYTPKNFDKSVTDQLMEITRGLKGWIPKVYEDYKIDYYQYLIFKLQDGHLTHILP